MTATPKQRAYYIAMRKIESDLLTWYIHEADGDMTRAAKLLGIEPRHLYRRLKHCGVDGDAICDAALQGLPADVPPAIIDAATGAITLDAINNDDPVADGEPPDETASSNFAEFENNMGSDLAGEVAEIGRDARTRDDERTRGAQVR